MTRLVTIAAMVVALAAGVWLFMRNGDGPAGPADRRRPLDTGARLSPDASELVSLVRRGQGSEYHAVYSSSGSDQADTLRIEAWRKGDLARYDTTVRSGDDMVRTASFRLRGRMILCTRQDDDDWGCRTSREDGTGADPLVGPLVDELSDGEVTAKDGRVGGRRARCFTILEGKRRAEICLGAEGIPLAYRTKGSVLEIAQLETGEGAVSDRIFDPPAV